MKAFTRGHSYMAVSLDGTISIFTAENGALVKSFESEMGSGCPMSLAVSQYHSEILLVHDKYIQIFDPFVTASTKKISPKTKCSLPGRDTSGGAVWSGFVDSYLVALGKKLSGNDIFIQVSDTLGLVLYDMRESPTRPNIISYPSPQYLNVASKDLVHASATPDKRYILILTSSGVHIVDLADPNKMAPFKSFLEGRCAREEVGSTLQYIACGQTSYQEALCLVWVAESNGQITVSKLDKSGRFSDSAILTTDMYKNCDICEIIADRSDGGRAYLTTRLAGCVIVVDYSTLAVTGAKPHLLSVMSSPITSVDQTGDGSCFLIGGADGIVRIWDMQKSSLKHSSSFSCHTSTHRLGAAVAHCVFLR